MRAFGADYRFHDRYSEYEKIICENEGRNPSNGFETQRSGVFDCFNCIEMQ